MFFEPPSVFGRDHRKGIMGRDLLAKILVGGMHHVGMCSERLC